MNLSGSGNETSGHLRLANRMTLMFCAFEGEALILRVYGTAKTLHPRDPDWASAVTDFPEMAGSRQVFDVTIDGVQTSCGTGVPVNKNYWQHYEWTSQFEGAERIAKQWGITRDDTACLHKFHNKTKLTSSNLFQLQTRSSRWPSK